MAGEEVKGHVGFAGRPKHLPVLAEGLVFTCFTTLMIQGWCRTIPDHSFQYQAKSWRRPRRVVVKIEWHAGELFPRVGFIVTNLAKHSKNVVKFYNGRGTAEQWIKEGKNAVKWTKLSCRTFKDNQTRQKLFALAYNLGM